MKTANVNWACGGAFVANDDRINFGCISSGPAVQPADLLERLQLVDGAAVLVYSFHFLEHISHNQVPAFLADCLRILKPGGVSRLVVPDLENLCRTYLAHGDCGEYQQADFLVLDLLDQCVRREAGGELGRYYQQLRLAPNRNAEALAFVRHRAGEELIAPPPHSSFSRGAQEGCRQGRAPLDPGCAAAVAQGLSRAKREFGSRGRAPSLALRLPSAAALVGRCRLCGDRAVHRGNQPWAPLHLPSPRPRRRWLTAQGRRVAVHRSAEARISRWHQPAVGFQLGGGRHG